MYVHTDTYGGDIRYLQEDIDAHIQMISRDVESSNQETSFLILYNNALRLQTMVQAYMKAMAMAVGSESRSIQNSSEESESSNQETSSFFNFKDLHEKFIAFKEKFIPKEKTNGDILIQQDKPRESLKTIRELITKIEELSRKRLNEETRFSSLLKQAIRLQKFNKNKFSIIAGVPIHIVEEVFDTKKREMHIQNQHQLIQEYERRKQQLVQDHEIGRKGLEDKEKTLNSSIADKKEYYNQEIEVLEKDYQKKLSIFLEAYLKQKEEWDNNLNITKGKYNEERKHLERTQAEILKESMQKIGALRERLAENEEALQQLTSEIQERNRELQEDSRRANALFWTIFQKMQQEGVALPRSFEEYLSNRVKLLERICHIEKEGVQIPYMHLIVYTSEVGKDRFLLSGQITDCLQITKLDIPPDKIRGVAQPLNRKELSLVSDPTLWNILKDEVNQNGRFYLQMLKSNA